MKFLKVEEEKIIKKRIVELLDFENRSMSIREVTLKLKSKYDIKRSPQVIKRLLEELVKENKILLLKPTFIYKP